MADPPAGFAKRPLVTVRLAAGDRWRRMYKLRHPDPLGWGSGLSRFSDPTGALFGVVYLGSSLKVCFVETILRDRGDALLDPFPVRTGELTLWQAAEVVVREDLTVIDLTGDGPLRMGVPSDVARAKDQTLARRWSEAFWRHERQVDGVLYPSRLNEEPNVAIYDRGLAKLEATASVPLLGTGAALAQILDDLNITLVRSGRRKTL